MKCAKYSGSGNKFFITYAFFPLRDLFHFCEKHEMDGLLLIENSPIADARMRIYNKDGSEANMCGNGLRCVAAFIGKKDCLIETPNDPLLKVHACTFFGKKIWTQMGAPLKIELDRKIIIDNKEYNYDFLDTGAPHALLYPKREEMDAFVALGSKIRFAQVFAPQGTNVNFVFPTKKGVFLRTFEKGVEKETLACGTGAVATALCLASRHLYSSPITILTAGGEKLVVSFTKMKEKFENVGLTGEAIFLGSVDFPIGELSSYEL